MTSEIGLAVLTERSHPTSSCARVEPCVLAIVVRGEAPDRRAGNQSALCRDRGRLANEVCAHDVFLRADNYGRDYHGVLLFRRP